jgi:hypothetical protein
VRIRSALLAIAVSLLAACQGGGGGDAASTTSTVPVTTVPAPGDCAGFRGATTVLRSVGPSAPAALIDAQAGGFGCLDQVTFTFRSLGDGTPPGYTVQYEDPAQHPFLDGDPPVPISLPGSAFLVVRISPALSVDPFAEGAPSTYPGNLSLEYGDHHHLQIVRKLPDVDETVVWVIGLDAPRPFLVDRAANPTRVTVFIG